jgi:hypothetical protein
LGISANLAEKVIEGGQQLQSIYQKLGIERARSIPKVKGYDYWAIVDINGLMPQGLLNTFWQQKRSTSQYFRQFNSAAVLLLPDLSPYGKDRVYSSGERATYRVECSNYSPDAIDNATVSWSVEAEGQVCSQGRLGHVNIPQGTIAEFGRIELTMPRVEHPVKVELRVKIEGRDIENAWDFICFPAKWPHARLGSSWASPVVYQTLRATYPVLRQARPDLAHREGQTRGLLITERLDDQALGFLKAGGKVLLLGLGNFSPLEPGFWLGWWVPNDQRGTAMAESTAFGDFPTEGGMPSFAIFRIFHDAVLLQGSMLNHVDPLMVTLSRAAYSMSVFQTRVGTGKLFATGLDLSSGRPEGRYLLDQFVRYVESDRFRPQTEMAPDDLQAILASPRKR